jgi:hypothetical protein
MKEDIPYSTIMIDLDALLDTRIAVLASQYPDSLKDTLTTSYWDRDIDEFPGVPYEMFKSTYASRDRSVLQYTMITPMAMMLAEYTERVLRQLISSPMHYRPKIDINIYPYDLSEDEVAVISKSVVQLTKGRSDVEIVRLPPADITVAYIKANLTSMIMYDYIAWTDARFEDFKTKTCPEVQLLAPRLYFKRKDPVPPKTDPFKGTEELMAPFIGLKILPVEHFCFVARPSQPEAD